MRDVTFRIEGLSPLLMNNGESMNATAAGDAKAPTLTEAEAEARPKLYRLSNGDLYLPMIAIMKSMLGATTGTKFGKHSAKKYLMGTVLAQDTHTILKNPRTGAKLRDWKIDSRRVVIRATGGSVIRHRPVIEKWACEFTLEIDNEYIGSSDSILILLNKAGRVVGVGDFRPERFGTFGRYIATVVRGAFRSKEKAERAKKAKKAG